MQPRTAEITRRTKETDIAVALALDGEGAIDIATGFGFADHMIELTAYWAGFDLKLACTGDLHIDAHHTLEDVGLVLGECFLLALADKQGIGRVGFARVPMDEALTEVVVDISGRPYIVYEDGGLLPGVVAGQEADLWREFYKSFAFKAQINLHMRFLYGQNGHHLLESAAKGLGLALRQAVRRDRAGVFSTKGSLD
jgi:imidazoleglycerol-phosphate dehydratase